MKYIDADKLKEGVTRLIASTRRNDWPLAEDCLRRVIDIIDSLLQGRPDNEDIDRVAHELYEHLYELKRRNNVPTNLYDKQEIIDLWKAGIEYGRNHPKHEQSDVYLDKAARNVYESWMGGTMNDVRRDMVNLGMVLNASKEE